MIMNLINFEFTCSQCVCVISAPTVEISIVGVVCGIKNKMANRPPYIAGSYQIGPPPQYMPGRQGMMVSRV